MSTFKKLDDLPKGKPNTYDEVMKAMAELHKGVLKQAAMYGGKNSKLFIPQVVETSLLQRVTAGEQLDESDCDEAGRLMDVAQGKASALAKHLEESGDGKALGMLGALMKIISSAMKASS